MIRDAIAPHRPCDVCRAPVLPADTFVSVLGPGMTKPQFMCGECGDEGAELFDETANDAIPSWRWTAGGRS